MAGKRRSEGGRLRVASFSKRLQVAGDETRLLSFAVSVDRTRFDHVVIIAVSPDRERDARIGPMLRRYREAGIDVELLDLELNGMTDALNYARRAGVRQQAWRRP